MKIKNNVQIGETEDGKIVRFIIEVGGNLHYIDFDTQKEDFIYPKTGDFLYLKDIKIEEPKSVVTRK